MRETAIRAPSLEGGGVMTNPTELEPNTQATAPRTVIDFILLAIAGIVLAADQASKAWVVANIPINTTFEILPPLREIFVLTYISNSGAAFGMFPQLGLLFTFIALAVSLVIVFYHRSIPAEQWIVRLSLGLQLGGALGNLIDRLRFGYVVDMLYIADSAIVCGVILLMWHMMRTPKAETPTAVSNESREKIEPQGDGLG
jgi:signal peptidase II